MRQSKSKGERLPDQRHCRNEEPDSTTNTSEKTERERTQPESQLRNLLDLTTSHCLLCNESIPHLSPQEYIRHLKVCKQSGTNRHRPLRGRHLSVRGLSMMDISPNTNTKDLKSVNRAPGPRSRHISESAASSIPNDLANETNFIAPSPSISNIPSTSKCIQRKPKTKSKHNLHTNTSSETASTAPNPIHPDSPAEAVSQKDENDKSPNEIIAHDKQLKNTTPHGNAKQDSPGYEKKGDDEEMVPTEQENSRESHDECENEMTGIKNELTCGNIQDERESHDSEYSNSDKDTESETDESEDTEKQSWYESDDSESTDKGNSTENDDSENAEKEKSSSKHKDFDKTKDEKSVENTEKKISRNNNEPKAERENSLQNDELENSKITEKDTATESTESENTEKENLSRKDESENTDRDNSSGNNESESTDKENSNDNSESENTEKENSTGNDESENNENENSTGNDESKTNENENSSGNDESENNENKNSSGNDESENNVSESSTRNDESENTEKEMSQSGGSESSGKDKWSGNHKSGNTEKDISRRDGSNDTRNLHSSENDDSDNNDEIKSSENEYSGNNETSEREDSNGQLKNTGKEMSQNDGLDNAKNKNVSEKEEYTSFENNRKSGKNITRSGKCESTEQFSNKKIIANKETNSTSENIDKNVKINKNDGSSSATGDKRKNNDNVIQKGSEIVLNEDERQRQLLSATQTKNQETIAMEDNPGNGESDPLESKSKSERQKTIGNKQMSKQSREFKATIKLKIIGPDNFESNVNASSDEVKNFRQEDIAMEVEECETFKKESGDSESMYWDESGALTRSKSKAAAKKGENGHLIGKENEFKTYVEMCPNTIIKSIEKLLGKEKRDNCTSVKPKNGKCTSKKKPTNNDNKANCSPQALICPQNAPSCSDDLKFGNNLAKQCDSKTENTKEGPKMCTQKKRKKLRKKKQRTASDNSVMENYDSSNSGLGNKRELSAAGPSWACKLPKFRKKKNPKRKATRSNTKKTVPKYYRPDLEATVYKWMETLPSPVPDKPAVKEKFEQEPFNISVKLNENNIMQTSLVPFNQSSFSFENPISSQRVTSPPKTKGSLKEYPEFNLSFAAPQNDVSSTFVDTQNVDESSPMSIVTNSDKIENIKGKNDQRGFEDTEMETNAMEGVNDLTSKYVLQNPVVETTVFYNTIEENSIATTNQNEDNTQAGTTNEDTEGQMGEENEECGEGRDEDILQMLNVADIIDETRLSVQVAIWNIIRYLDSRFLNFLNDDAYSEFHLSPYASHPKIDLPGSQNEGDDDSTLIVPQQALESPTLANSGPPSSMQVLPPDSPSFPNDFAEQSSSFEAVKTEENTESCTSTSLSDSNHSKFFSPKSCASSSAASSQVTTLKLTPTELTTKSSPPSHSELSSHLQELLRDSILPISRPEISQPNSNQIFLPIPRSGLTAPIPRSEMPLPISRPEMSQPISNAERSLPISQGMSLSLTQDLLLPITHQDSSLLISQSVLRPENPQPRPHIPAQNYRPDIPIPSLSHSGVPISRQQLPLPLCRPEMHLPISYADMLFNSSRPKIQLPISRPEMPKISRAEVLPISCAEALPISRPEMLLVSRPGMLPISRPEIPPISRTEVVPISHPEMLLVSHPEILPISRPEMLPISRPEMLSISHPEMLPISHPEMQLPISRPEIHLPISRHPEVQIPISQPENRLQIGRQDMPLPISHQEILLRTTRSEIQLPMSGLQMLTSISCPEMPKPISGPELQLPMSRPEFPNYRSDVQIPISRTGLLAPIYGPEIPIPICHAEMPIPIHRPVMSRSIHCQEMPRPIHCQEMPRQIHRQEIPISTYRPGMYFRVPHSEIPPSTEIPLSISCPEMPLPNFPEIPLSISCPEMPLPNFPEMPLSISCPEMSLPNFHQDRTLPLPIPHPVVSLPSSSHPEVSLHTPELQLTTLPISETDVSQHLSELQASALPMPSPIPSRPESLLSSLLASPPSAPFALGSEPQRNPFSPTQQLTSRHPSSNLISSELCVQNAVTVRYHHPQTTHIAQSRPFNTVPVSEVHGPWNHVHPSSNYRYMMTGAQRMVVADPNSGRFSAFATRMTVNHESGRIHAGSSSMPSQQHPRTFTPISPYRNNTNTTTVSNNPQFRLFQSHQVISSPMSIARHASNVYSGPSWPTTTTPGYQHRCSYYPGWNQFHYPSPVHQHNQATPHPQRQAYQNINRCPHYSYSGNNGSSINGNTTQPHQVRPPVPPKRSRSMRNAELSNFPGGGYSGSEREIAKRGRYETF